jgi:hypothetical protein
MPFPERFCLPVNWLAIIADDATNREGVRHEWHFLKPKALKVLIEKAGPVIS